MAAMCTPVNTALSGHRIRHAGDMDNRQHSSRVRAGVVTVPNETVEQKLARAKGYPYPRMARSFLFHNGSVLEFASRWAGTAHLPHMEVVDPSTGRVRRVQELCGGLHAVQRAEELTPVLAIGSNAAPQQLARKYPPHLFPEGVAIPVVECVLEGFDVVYAPSLAAYGSCPATLEASPGTAVRVFITYLAGRALQRMHETEGSYSLLRLHDLRLHVDLSLPAFLEGGEAAGELLSSVMLYNHQHGSLKLPLATQPAGSPVALAEIDALGRRFPALTQPQLLHSLRLAFASQPAHCQPMGGHTAVCLDSLQRRHAQGGEHAHDDLDSWILSQIECMATRRALVARMTQWAQPLRYSRMEQLLALGYTNEKAQLQPQQPPAESMLVV